MMSIFSYTLSLDDWFCSAIFTFQVTSQWLSRHLCIIDIEISPLHHDTKNGINQFIAQNIHYNIIHKILDWSDCFVSDLLYYQLCHMSLMRPFICQV